MKSLEERHAEREARRKSGPLGPQIEKDEPGEETVIENEREPMRNKGPGSSREDPKAVAKVIGDDTIASSKPVVSPENAVLENPVSKKTVGWKG